MRTPGPPRGRTVLLGLRVAALGASVAFTVLLLSTLLMATPGTLEFIPPGEEADFRYADGILYIDTAFTVGNRGYHDLTSLSFAVRAVVEDEFVVTDFATIPVDVPAGQRTEVPLSIPLDVGALVDTGYVVFVPANVTFTLGLRGTTTRSLLDFTGSYTFTEPFEPLVSLFDVDFANSTVSGSNWTVPYTVETAAFLSGTAESLISVVNDDGSFETETNVSVALGEFVEGEMTFPLDPGEVAELQEQQTLTATVELTLPGGLPFETVRTFEWGGL